MKYILLKYVGNRQFLYKEKNTKSVSYKKQAPVFWNQFTSTDWLPDTNQSTEYIQVTCNRQFTNAKASSKYIIQNMEYDFIGINRMRNILYLQNRLMK